MPILSPGADAFLPKGQENFYRGVRGSHVIEHYVADNGCYRSEALVFLLTDLMHLNSEVDRGKFNKALAEARQAFRFHRALYAKQKTS